MTYFFYTVQPCYISIWNYSTEKDTSKRDHLKLFAKGCIIHSLFDNMVPSWSNFKAQRCCICDIGHITQPIFGIMHSPFCQTIKCMRYFSVDMCIWKKLLEIKATGIIFKMQVTECMLHRIASGRKLFFLLQVSQTVWFGDCQLLTIWSWLLLAKKRL